MGDIPIRAARAYGDRRALVDDRGELTYNELEAQDHRFAHALVGVGVASREAVAVMAPNCKEYMVAYFGITKMDAAATLVNMLGGEHHVVYALKQTKPTVIVIHADLLPVLKAAAELIGFVEHVVVIGAEPNDVEAPLEMAITDRQIAQCLFYSGSTSDPKAL